MWEMFMLRPVRRISYFLCLISMFGVLSAGAQRGTQSGEWRVYGGDGGSTRYSSLDQINRDNVKDLRVAWTWKSDNFGRSEFKNETTPIMVNGVLYFTAGDRRSVVAIDAGTGETIWVWRPDEGPRYERAPRRNSGRGVSYWTDGVEQRIYTITPGFQLVALNAKTGAPVQGFDQDGVVDIFTQLDPGAGFEGDLIGRIGSSSPPVISKDVIVVGPALLIGLRANKENVKADVMGFDVRTGKKLWAIHTVPRKGEPGYETWENGSADYTGNAGVWTTFSVDEELGYVYLPIEAPTNDVFGGHRLGNNLYSDTLMAADIKTGKVVWHRQLVHHDIWDFDIPSSPILVDINANGRATKAVVQLTKQNYAYVFDRVTGEPVWPMPERPVPQSDVPGERTSPTQPIPTKPPAYDVQGLTTNDLIDFTPAMRGEAMKALEGFRYGPLFTPPSLAAAADRTKGVISVPGFTGGANWESGAADPETGFVYVGSQTLPSILALVPPQPNTPNSVNANFVSGGGGVPTVNGLPLLKPPYGRITAYDMNKGEIAWQMANGDTPPNIKSNPALQGLNVQRTGSPSRAGLLVTKTLLFAGEGWGGQPMFRAHDKQTGAIVWETRVPAGIQAGLPMTYSHEGRQYIVFSAGDPASRTPAQLVAYALPPAQ
jgi:quinoprotein glucose dehydrogenase